MLLCFVQNNFCRLQIQLGNANLFNSHMYIKIHEMQSETKTATGTPQYRPVLLTLGADLPQ